jgi:hypothetical protein
MIRDKARQGGAIGGADALEPKKTPITQAIYIISYTIRNVLHIMHDLFYFFLHCGYFFLHCVPLLYAIVQLLCTMCHCDRRAQRNVHHIPCHGRIHHAVACTMISSLHATARDDRMQHATGRCCWRERTRHRHSLGCSWELSRSQLTQSATA